MWPLPVDNVEVTSATRVYFNPVPVPRMAFAKLAFGIYWRVKKASNFHRLVPWTWHGHGLVACVPHRLPASVYETVKVIWLESVYSPRYWLVRIKDDGFAKRFTPASWKKNKNTSGNYNNEQTAKMIRNDMHFACFKVYLCLLSNTRFGAVALVTYSIQEL